MEENKKSMDNFWKKNTEDLSSVIEELRQEFKKVENIFEKTTELKLKLK